MEETHSDVYFNNMFLSLGDKKKLIQYINPGIVLDVGAGGGDLSEAIRIHGSDIIALDGSDYALEKIHGKYPYVETVKAFAHTISTNTFRSKFDTIVCSSVLHEVFSYGATNYPSQQILDQTLHSFYSLLKPGGRLIIRDGVMPSNWNKKVFLEFLDDRGEDFLEIYKNLSPFYSSEPSYRKVFLKREKTNLYETNMSSLMEFLYTYTWGFESSLREVKELYGIYTEEEYVCSLQDKGFKIIESHQYLQPGYPEHLKSKVKFWDENKNHIPYPSSNMIIVAEKS